MPRPVIHQTDLFRPHEEPDDHWDLATSLAPAYAGLVDLRGVIIDHPPNGHPGTPDEIALAQINHITGLQMPHAVGLPTAFPAGGESDAAALLLETLAASEDPVAIVIGGSCRDVASAAARAPELFRENCGGVYLNAGSGTRDPTLIGELEYNVRLNAAAFSAIFHLSCPVYWMPCFETTPPTWQVQEYGTWFSFRQETLLNVMSRRMRCFFLSMLEPRKNTDCQGQLEAEPTAELLMHFGSMSRNMWCTAGFFHAARLMVSIDGDLEPRGPIQRSPAYIFQPIEVNCTESGIVQWSPSQTEIGR